MRVLNQKYLLKKASGKLVPASILGRIKQPYRAPDGSCFFDTGAPASVSQLLSPQSVEENGIFGAQAVSALVIKFGAGSAVSV